MTTANWAENALADLRRIEAYLSRNAAQYAQGVIDRIFACAEQLAAHPRLGAEVPEYGDESIRELFEHPHRIVYRVVADDRVDVVAVVHASRRMPRRL